MSEMSRDRKVAACGLAVLLLAALILRLGWALSRPTGEAALAELPDQKEYLALARNLIEGRGLQFYDERFKADERQHGIIWAYRTPGYPLFLAACGGSIRLARGVQAILDASTVLGVYWLAKRWLGGRGGLVAGGIVAFNPFLIYMSGLILSETLFTALLVWAMVLLVWRRSFVWGGMVLALSVLVRPGAMALPILLGIAAAFVNRGRDGAYHPRWPLPVGATMVLLVAAALFPWALRNRLVLGQWIWTTTNGGITAYDGANPDARGDSDQSFVKAMPRLGRMDEIERDRYLGSQARRFVQDNPVRAMQLALIKAARTWSPVPLSQQFGGQRVYWLAGLLFSLPLDVLVLWGLWRRKARNGRWP